MTGGGSSVQIGFGEEAQPQPARPVPDRDTPFRIALLGDFSGRVNRGLEGSARSLRDRRPVLVDRDNFDEVLARFKPELHLPIGGSDSPKVALRFGDLDDFHPDRLYERMAAFQQLRKLRARLADPSSFAKAAEELLGPDQKPAESSSGPAGGAAPPAEVPDNLLDQMIEDTEGPSASRATSRGDYLQEFLRKIVEPHLVAGTDPRQPELLAQVDEAASKLMRALLHHPDFQALEAAWRAVVLLVRRIETGPNLKLYLIDVSKAELAADLDTERDPSQSATYRLLVESSTGTAGGEPWALLAGNYTFGAEPRDLVLLGMLGGMAKAAGAPWIAAADSRLVGCDSMAATPDPNDWRRDVHAGWAQLRRFPEARHVGLALPRFLLRLPYGKDTEPCEHFAFEEMGRPADHERYLWGNPAFACALLLAQSFTSHGWELRPGVRLNVERLPLHIYRHDGESVAQPCAEVLMTERAAGRIMERGLMPLASLKDQDEVHLVRFQSIADPAASLAGRWG